VRRSIAAVLCVSAAILFLGASVASAGEAEKVANPAYKAWSGHKVGTVAKLEAKVTTKGEAAKLMPQATMTINMTSKLIELTPDKAVVEITMTMPGMGDMPGRKNEIPAKIDSDKADETALIQDPTMQGTATDIKKGDEEITVIDKKLKCHWFSATMKQGGREMNTKVWTYPDVPGNVVQMEARSDQVDMDLKLTGYEEGK